MVALLLTTTITCSEGLKIIQNVSNAINLTYQQRIELIQTVRQFIPSCPLKVVSDEKSKK